MRRSERVLVGAPESRQSCHPAHSPHLTRVQCHLTWHFPTSFCQGLESLPQRKSLRSEESSHGSLIPCPSRVDSQVVTVAWTPSLGSFRHWQWLGCPLESCIFRGLVAVCEGGQLDRPGPHTVLQAVQRESCISA